MKRNDSFRSSEAFDCAARSVVFKQGPNALQLANAFSIGLEESATASEFFAMNEIDRHKLRRNLDSQIIQSLEDRGDESPFELSNVLSYLKDGVGVILEDDFSLCFKKEVEQPWNFTWYLMITWTLGVAFRYCVVLPLRIVVMLSGFVIGMLGITIMGIIYKKKPEKRVKVELKFITFMAQACVAAFGGVVKYHGVLPRKKANQIYVANHTTMNDVLLLLQLRPFCIVGQAHSAPFVKYLQNVVLNSLRCIWFDRKAKHDREKVKRRLREHISDVRNPRLLLFPEGTCVNNEFCVQFKRGAFSMGDEVEVCPVAIKYNKLFSDPYWVSRDQPFHLNVLELMSSWAVVADVWFLPPQKRRLEESVDEFASRVKRSIAEAAGLKDVAWNGYLKHYKPSDRVIQAKKQIFKNRLLKRFRNLDRLIREFEKEEAYVGGGTTYGFPAVKPRKVDL